VTYGAADTYPSPLLSKCFFLSPNFVIKELREDPRKLGIGSANGVRGLSALEGMVAAIEVCTTVS
jgi:mediator of RNA polymerase II transcription subunit 25